MCWKTAVWNTILFFLTQRVKIILWQKPIHLELTGLGGLYLDGYRPNIEGTWSFDWNLERSDMVRICSPGTALGDTGAVVEKIEISPISAQVAYRFPRTKTKEKGYNDSGEEIDVELTEDPPELKGVKMKDGTIYSYLYGGPGRRGFSSDEGKNMSTHSDSTGYWILTGSRAFYFLNPFRRTERH